MESKLINFTIWLFIVLAVALGVKLCSLVSSPAPNSFVTDYRGKTPRQESSYRAPGTTPGQIIHNPSGDLEILAGTILNLNGYLCAEVRRITRRGEYQFEVDCTEYRDGRGRASYLINTETGAAWQK